MPRNIHSILQKVPKSAFVLYTHLYCRKKKRAGAKYHRHNLSEATHSWLSLSQEERSKFEQKLEECRSEYRKRLAKFLKETEPYLKEKKKKSAKKKQKNLNLQDVSQNLHGQIYNQGDTATNIENNDRWMNNSRDAVDPQENAADYNGNAVAPQENVPNADEHAVDLQENSVDIHENPVHPQENVYSEEPVAEPLKEPVPPAKFPKDLFNIVMEVEGNSKQTWQNVTSKEKSMYRNTLRRMKKDYIKKYKAFLESLPSKQLFEYYHKTITS